MRESVENAAGYVTIDPKVALAELRRVAEKLTDDVAANNQVLFPRELSFFDRLNRLKVRGYIPADIADRLHKIRILGNEAVHDGRGTTAEASEAIDLVLAAVKWYEREFPYPRAAGSETFEQQIRSLASVAGPATCGSSTSVNEGVEPPVLEPISTPAVTAGPQQDWLTTARRKTEGFLDVAERQIRATSAWAEPHASRIKIAVRTRATRALRGAAKALTDFSDKHGH